MSFIQVVDGLRKVRVLAVAGITQCTEQMWSGISGTLIQLRPEYGTDPIQPTLADLGVWVTANAQDIAMLVGYAAQVPGCWTVEEARENIAARKALVDKAKGDLEWIMKAPPFKGAQT